MRLIDADALIEEIEILRSKAQADYESAILNNDERARLACANRLSTLGFVIATIKRQDEIKTLEEMGK